MLFIALCPHIREHCEMGLLHQFPMLIHHSLGSSCRLQIPDFLFKFYLEFLLIAKFLVQLNTAYF